MDDLGLGLDIKGSFKGGGAVEDRDDGGIGADSFSLEKFTGTPVKPKPKIVFSEQQKAIFEMFKNKDSGHVTIIARAGSSKTTTSIEGGKYAPESSILYAAFGKDIAVELTARLPDSRCLAKTIHALGMGIIRQKRPKVKIEKSISYSRVDKAIAEYFERPENRWDDEALLYLRQNQWQPVKILELVKQMCPYADTRDEIIDVAIDMATGSTPLRETLSTDFSPEREIPPLLDRVADIVLMVLEWQFHDAMFGRGELIIDFCDMIWLPVRCVWVMPRFKLVVIDEAQDLCFTQIELATALCSGRIFLVGDNRQAIYAWRGADSNALDRMSKQLKSTIMKLTTCYRCAKSIIREAQRYCSDIQAWENSPEGYVGHIKIKELWALVKPGDFVVSRANAPLAAICLKLILNNVPAKMGGADIGKKLLKTLDEVEGKGRTKMPFKNGEDMWNRLLAWGVEEAQSIGEMVRRKFSNAKEERIKSEIESRVEMLKDELGIFNVMLKQLHTPEAVKARMKTLFERDDDNSDQKNDRSKYVFCCSVHKSKGLEAKTVFVIADTLRTKNEEELNICYVAVTRAQENLYYVKMKEDDFEDIDDAKDIERTWIQSRPALSAAPHCGEDGEVEVVDAEFVIE